MKKAGIFEYLLTCQSDPYAGKLLNLRTFDEKDKRRKYHEQHGVCPICGKGFEYDDMRRRPHKAVE